MRIDLRWFTAGALLGLGVAGLILLFLLPRLLPAAAPVPTPTFTPAAPTPTPPPTATFTPAPSPTPAASPTPTTPCYLGRVVEQSEPPAELQGGKKMELTWVLENRGSCPWEKPQAQPTGENPPEAQAALDPQGPIEPGQSLTITWNITAPAKKGEYTFQWQLLDGDQVVPVEGQDILEVSYQVTQDEVVMPPVLDQGTITLAQNQYADLDSDDQPDFKYNVPSENDQSILHIGGRVRFYELWLPIHQAFYTCFYAPYGTFNAIQDPASRIGYSYCYVTNSLRVGAMRIENVYKHNGVWYLTISYVTWTPPRPHP